MFQEIDSISFSSIGLSTVKKIISYYNMRSIFYFSLPKKATINAIFEH
jgi:hypothetical protein